MSSSAFEGLLPSNQPYILTNSVVEGQAENYHAKSPSGSSVGWREIPMNAVGPSGVTFENATGAGNLAMQVPDITGSRSVGYASGPSIDYAVFFAAPGTYRLYLRWDG